MGRDRGSGGEVGSPHCPIMQAATKGTMASYSRGGFGELWEGYRCQFNSDANGIAYYLQYIKYIQCRFMLRCAGADGPEGIRGD